MVATDKATPGEKILPLKWGHRHSPPVRWSLMLAVGEGHNAASGGTNSTRLRNNLNPDPQHGGSSANMRDRLYVHVRSSPFSPANGNTSKDGLLHAGFDIVECCLRENAKSDTNFPATATSHRACASRCAGGRRNSCCVHVLSNVPKHSLTTLWGLGGTVQ